MESLKAYEEEEIREVLSKIWRNNPESPVTFHKCKTEQCNNPARDSYCDLCLIDQVKKRDPKSAAILEDYLIHVISIRLLEEELCGI